MLLPQLSKQKTEATKSVQTPSENLNQNDPKWLLSFHVWDNVVFQISGLELG